MGSTRPVLVLKYPGSSFVFNGILLLPGPLLSPPPFSRIGAGTSRVLAVSELLLVKAEHKALIWTDFGVEFK